MATIQHESSHLDSSSIQLPGSEIADLSLVDGTFRIHFARAFIVKTMTGSIEKTLWWQAGDLLIDAAEPERPLPRGAWICEGGDIDENVYTYRDMIPIPLNARGRIRCDLRLRESEEREERICVSGETVRLELHDTPKYIRHIRD